ncbi:hypothetical protein A9P82_00465 [Arachidicoccus ginsenosidimutans]|uniref:alginate lyase family protein n=1 Tax=Arachidicoccus sp. BS20 TaxID=1850526 RepID=UPI0007F11EC1|nr:alginate lyase family protein [Arachidicoccus sp. BS20]ANI87922.1 hypothetical protein A9P82_00465 [Arachidicoccus sp. BS20]
MKHLSNKFLAVTSGVFLISIFSAFITSANNNNKYPAHTHFIHPGILNTAENLDFIASQLSANNAERKAAYQKILDFINAHKYPTSFPSTVYVGSNGHTSPSKTQIRSDAELAYAFALKFAAAGNMDDAQKAIGILNGWAYHFHDYQIIDSHKDNAHQPSLETSWTTPIFVAAAEIVRYYKPKGVSAKWSKKDIQQFENYLNLVKDDYINRIPNYHNNWNVSAGYAKISIGVFLNSDSVYNDGKKMLYAVFPSVIESDGTMPELCVRHDCVHYQYSLTGFTYAAEIADIQDDSSLYSALDKRISAGYDFTRKAYNQSTDCNYCSVASPLFPGVEVAYKHYGTNSMKSLREMQAPLGVPIDNTFLGFTTFTHYGLPSQK